MGDNSWKNRLKKFGFCSLARHDNPAQDAAIEAELTAYAKLHKLEFTKGLMCFSLHPLTAKVTWEDEKLSQPKGKRR